jgi:hypothetical protein
MRGWPQERTRLFANLSDVVSLDERCYDHAQQREPDEPSIRIVLVGIDDVCSSERTMVGEKPAAVVAARVEQ